MTRLIALLVLSFLIQPILAQEYEKIISQEFLRTQFGFSENDRIKHFECKNKSYPTCTYIWGAKSKKDANRIKHGLTPSGNKLQIIYAQAHSQNDFQRVRSTYTDAVNVDDIGTESAWSDKRKQLSLITDNKLIIHIHIEANGVSEPKEKAISIAKHLLSKLSLGMAIGNTSLLITSGTIKLGDIVHVTWQGANDHGDQIVLRGSDSDWGSSQYTAWGNPVGIGIPQEPALYELIYNSLASGVIATLSIDCRKNQVSIAGICKVLD